MPKTLTHDDLRKLAMSVLKRQHYKGYGKGTQVGFSCSIVLSELTTAGDIPDAIGWSWGHSVLIECKTSRSDFFADAKKPQRMNGTGSGELRYFMAPVGLLKPVEIPIDWGLLEVDGRNVIESLHAPKRELDMDGHLHEKKLLLSTIRRIRTREFLIISNDVPEGEIA